MSGDGVRKRYGHIAEPCVTYEKLLPRRARVRGIGGLAAPPRIDIEPAAARVARIHAERSRRTALSDVHVDALDAMLVEIGVIAERDEIAQERRAIDARTRIADRD